MFTIRHHHHRLLSNHLCFGRCFFPSVFSSFFFVIPFACINIIIFATSSCNDANNDKILYLCIFELFQREKKRNRKWCSRILQYIPSLELEFFYLRLEKLNRFHFYHFDEGKNTHAQWAAIHTNLTLSAQGKMGKNDGTMCRMMLNLIPHNECLNGRSTTIHTPHFQIGTFIIFRHVYI